jgi:hypothetical protein
VKARDQLVALAISAHHQRDKHPLKGDRARESIDMRSVELTDVLRNADAPERDEPLLRGLRDSHVVLLGHGARPGGGPIPARAHARRVCQDRRGRLVTEIVSRYAASTSA